MQRDGRGRSRTACIAVAAIILAAALIAFFWKGSDSCGNGICRVEKGENCRGCPLDCGSCSVAGICGDGLCTGEEDSVKCPGDCRPSAECGDGKCDAGVGEDCAACASDCGECSLEHGCGDGRCDSRETFLSCPAIAMTYAVTAYAVRMRIAGTVLRTVNAVSENIALPRKRDA